MFQRLEDVTYEAFGIDPKTFYKNKFNSVPHTDYFANPVNRFLLGAERMRYLAGKLPGGRVLDVGCGSGILSLVAAKLGVKRILGIEIEPDAIHVMKKSKYSGMYGDYSSFSDELEHLSDLEEEEA